MTTRGVAYSCRCGCVNFVDETWGAIRCVSKCPYHVAALAGQPSGMAYYELLGTIRDGVPQPAAHVEQIEEALGKFAPGDGPALEVGGGASMYVPLLQQAGYRYHGVEPDPWAAAWTSETYDVPVTCAAFPHPLPGDGEIALVLCAHALEHMDDAPAALKAMRGVLRPGGLLYLIVPDDTDQTNPDHLWFFNADNLRSTLERVGFAVEKLVTRKYVKHENFLYCLAKKV